MKLMCSVLLSGAASLLLTLPAQAEDFWLKDEESGCELWSDEPAGDNDLIVWSGECDDAGKATGPGLAVWIKGDDIYSRYTGTMLGGKLHGDDGLLLIRSSDHDGFDAAHGSFANGNLHGEATILGADGSLFKGEFLDGVRDGAGLYVDTKGNSFQGQFVNDTADGLGYAFSAEGEAYAGQLADNKKNGLGVLFKENGQIFIGEFENDMASGVGRLEGPGGYFQGNFSDDKPNGPGVVVAEDGTTQQGRFVNGEPEGLVIVTKPDGSQTTETWRNGEKMQ